MNNYSYANVTSTFDRGYTGHEQLPTFGLINMNGRCYDPVTSSFLSVDAYVQSPESAQGFNRYSYCQNNPLRYTDPTGWQMVGGNRPDNPFHEDWSVSHVQHAYTPRDFGLMQLSDADPIVAWMAENEMHGGGLGGSDYTVDRKGYIENHGANERIVDVLYTFECWDNGAKDVYIEVPIGTLERKNTVIVEGINGVSYTLDMYTMNDDNLSTELFEFLAANTDVEWSQTFIGQSNSGKSVLSTSHDIKTEVGPGYLLSNGWTIRAHNHSHPYHNYPSKGDLKWAKTVHKKFPKAVLKICYKNHYYEYDELGPFMIPGYNSNVLNGVNVLDTMIKP